MNIEFWLIGYYTETEKYLNQAEKKILSKVFFVVVDIVKIGRVNIDRAETELLKQIRF